ncbi:MAG: thymidylate synthase [Bacteroidales bacterium]|nr:thymidylate synthase [Bacteroidales bacterium]
MTRFDTIYKDIVLDIIHNGTMQTGNVRAKYADGTPAYTKYIDNVNFTIKPEDGFPILQSKRVAWKTFFKEIDWIFRQMSNNVETLKYMGVNVWNEWQREDETIGKAYGYQLGKRSIRPIAAIDGRTVDKEMNQVEYILHEIQRNPRSRRIMTNLYDVDELHDMALEPCVFLTHWQVDDNNKLNLTVVQRSADMALGNPSNLAAYGLVHRRIAQVTGKELGNLNWQIFNAHIYDRHLKTLEEQVTADISHLETTQPKLILPDSLQYFSTPLYESIITDYKHNGNYKYEIAI